MRRVAIAAAKTVAVSAAIAGFMCAVYEWADLHPFRMFTPLVAYVVGALFYGFYRAAKTPPEKKEPKQ